MNLENLPHTCLLPMKWGLLSLIGQRSVFIGSTCFPTIETIEEIANLLNKRSCYTYYFTRDCHYQKFVHLIILLLILKSSSPYSLINYVTDSVVCPVKSGTYCLTT
jgi:hypothetical protein